ncbi:MAG: lysophospholipid acyltransferase family protein [Deltaproteobacteria bacterium]|nr:lysophospholipid acyltransferase family protein [Deltaproteobacteria bacterium]
MKKTLPTRTILLLFGSIPLKIRKALFRAIFILAYHFGKKNRLITLHNLIRSFPEKSLPEINRIAKNVYLNLGTVAAEFFEIPYLTRENMADWVKFEGLENYIRALSKRKGILLYTGHFGNWELGGACLGLQGMVVNIIYRALDNPVLEDFVAWFRTHTGHKVIPKGGAARKIVKLLRKNEIIGILIDQNVSWNEGVFVDFFGRPASTTTGLVALALQTGAPVVPLFIVRSEDGTYKIIIYEEAKITKTDDYEADLFENTQRLTGIIEDIVRKYPDQYFWLHQRWKTKKSQVPVNKR